MPTVKLDTWLQSDCTIGRLWFKGFQCFTLELRWRDNQNKISCIPSGLYNARKYISPKHGLVALLENVPDRSMIEIHSGNYTSQIEGCILVGDSIRFMNSDTIPDVSNSKATLNKLLDLLPDKFCIDIRRAG